jgi:AcrR family transcriptional regulator
VTREDWLNVARDILVSDGVAEVKVLAIGERLGVSRSSFYWYFKSRKDLLKALLDDWEGRNTAVILQHCGMRADTITAAVCNFFRCFLDPGLFDQGLDFAVREWARRDGQVRKRIDNADDARIAAITGMYARHGYSPYDADTRARVLYFMQLGYHALDQTESMALRLSRIEGYLRAFTGTEPRTEEIAALRTYVESRTPS